MDEQQFDVEDGEITSEEEGSSDETPASSGKADDEVAKRTAKAEKPAAKAVVAASVPEVPEVEDEMARSIREYINDRKRMKERNNSAGNQGQHASRNNKRKGDMDGGGFKRHKHQRRNVSREEEGN